MKKSEIIVGVHGGHAEIGSRGAKGYIDEVTCDRWISDEIVKTLKDKGFNAVELSVKSGTQQQVLNSLYVKSRNADTTHNISCHLNSASSELASGFEIWLPYSWSSRTTQYKRMTDLITAYCKYTSQVNRGLKMGGQLFVCNNLKNCILPEFCFVVNKEESKMYNTEKKCRKKARKFALYYIKHYLSKEVTE